MISIERLASFISNQHLGLILMPTEQCNFRCTYCYEDFQVGKMTQPIVEGVKNLIRQRMPELRSLSVEWFGGEPLSAKNIIYDIGSFIKRQLVEFPEVRFISGMTTNAFLLKGQTLQKLLSLGVNSFQISLDGPQEIHDQTRLRINGKGSFSEIWSNLLEMRKLDQKFKVTLRIHVTPENHDKLEQLIVDIRDNFSNDERFGVFFKAIENLGGDNGGTFSVLTGTDKQEIINRLYAKLQPEKNVSPLGQKEPYVCYASKPNNLVIRANGVIAKCTVVFNDQRNVLGKINSDGTVSIDQNKLNLWVRGLRNQDEKTLHCPLHGLPKLETLIPITAIA